MRKLLYGDFVRTIATTFDQALHNIAVEHNFELGDEFEVPLCKILRKVLPQKFGICRGYAINRDGDVAGDDIIIYERMRFPTARLIDDDWSLEQRVPIEAVLAYIEAKHSLTLEGDGIREGKMKKCCTVDQHPRATRDDRCRLDLLQPLPCGISTSKGSAITSANTCSSCPANAGT
jgi:uncharacterized protein DUF6602